MRYLFSLLLLFLFPAFAAAQSALDGLGNKANAQADAIAKKVEAKVQGQAAHSSQPFYRAQEALRKVMEEYSPEIISWDKMKELNARATERDLASRKMDLNAVQQNQDIQKITFQNSWPDYTALLKGFTHIYVGEAHGTESTPAEMVRLLQAVRKLHTNKRILLASEFSVTTHLEDFPLVKAQAPNSLVHIYPEVNRAADALNIDQLALDSRLGLDQLVLWEDEKGLSLPIQCGRYLVQRYLSSQEVPQAQELFSTLEMTLNYIPFGILERNRQWVRYIKAVEPFYDIIVVYAGQGHLGDTLSNDLPYMLDTPDFLNIFFSPTEEGDPQLDRTYEEMGKKARRNHLQRGHQSDKAEEALLEVLEKQQEYSGEWTDKTKPFWAQALAIVPAYKKNIPGKEILIYLPPSGVKMPVIQPAEKPHAQPAKPPVRKRNPDDLRRGNSFI